MVNPRTAHLRSLPAERGPLYYGHWTPRGAHVTAGILAAALRHGGGQAIHASPSTNAEMWASSDSNGKGNLNGEPHTL